MKKNISVCGRKIYWAMFALGLLLISTGRLFLDMSVTSSFITHIFSIAHPTSSIGLRALKFLQLSTVATGVLVIILSILLYKYNQKKQNKTLKLEMEYDVKKLIISFCIVIGFVVFCFNAYIQTDHVKQIYNIMGGLSNDEKREVRFGDFYKFVENCSEQIPEDDNILLLNASHKWFTNYYLYPRKLYRYPNSSVSLQNISKDWLDEKGIKWAISYERKFCLNDSKIIQVR